MPCSREGAVASAQTAASTGASSPASCRSASRPPMVPVPCRSRPSASRLTSAPIRASSAGKAAPAWEVRAGHPGIRTRPPVTTPAARNAAALDRSGSTTHSGAMGRPGSTTHSDRTESSTDTPAARSICTVIRMCGPDGTGGPSCRTRSPLSRSGAASSRALTNCEDCVASTVTSPPTRPPPP